MAHGDPQRPRTTGRVRYYTPGPPPRTARGKRRHKARTGPAKEHAEAVHDPRFALPVHKPTMFSDRDYLHMVCSV